MAEQPWRNPRPAPELSEVRRHLPARWFVPPVIKAWWPALVWAGLIFFLSTDTFSAAHTGTVLASVLRWIAPSLSPGQFETIHYFIRKTAHFTEYFIFCLLLFRAVRGERTGWRWTWALAALSIAACYATLDEIHQAFVASRTASPWDSLLDSTGAFVALFVVFAYWSCCADFWRKRHLAP